MRNIFMIACLAAGLGSIFGCGTSEPGTPLAAAAAAGRAGQVADLLAAGAEVDERDGAGMTSLAWAARFGQVECVNALVAAGATVDLPAGSNDWPALVHAIHKNHDAAAIALLSAGASVSDGGGKRGLRMAAGYGNAKLVAALLDAGARPDGEVLIEAVGGAWDIDYEWQGCEAHTDTVRALLDTAPDLRMPGGPWSSLARRHARKEGCTELLSILDGGRQQARAEVSAE